jgi:hypothetical protein
VKMLDDFPCFLSLAHPSEIARRLCNSVSHSSLCSINWGLPGTKNRPISKAEGARHESARGSRHPTVRFVAW